MTTTTATKTTAKTSGAVSDGTIPRPAGYVVTYRLAYADQRVTLCGRCADPESASAYPYPLGSVEHGGHMGWCQNCR